MGLGRVHAADAPQAAKPFQPYALEVVTITGEAPTPSGGFPGGLTSVSGEGLHDRHVLSPRDLSAISPNLTVFDANGDRVPRFSIRGLRENNFSVGEPVVSLYIDDVPYSDMSSRGVPFYGIEQAEFLRGPQGTLFGANRPGGIMNLLTRLPDNEWRGYGSFGYGSYDSYTGQAGVSGPVAKDQVYFGVSGVYGNRDGYFHNTTLDTDPDTRETLSGRVQMRWTPSEAWDITLTGAAERFRDGYVGIVALDQPGDPFDVARDFDGYVDTDSYTASLRAAYQPGPVKVVSVTAVRDWQQDLLQDFDFSAAPIALGFTRPEFTQWSQEIRLQSEHDAPLRWVAGFFFSNRESEYDSGSIYPNGFIVPNPQPPPPFFVVPGPLEDRTTAQTDDRNYAPFGQATYTLFDRLDVTAGLRLDVDQRQMQRQRADQTGGSGPGPIAPLDLDQEFTSVQPVFGLAYRLADKATAYASAKRGYQSGGFNISNNDPTLALYHPSDSWHFELGAKSTCWNDRVVAGVNLFWTDVEGYQVYRPITPVSFYMANAEQATLRGVEFELVAQPVDGLEVNAGVGYVNAEFDEFTDAANGANYDGNTINFVPEFTLNAGVQYRCATGLFARVEVLAVGDYYFDEANTRSQSAYPLLNAKLGWESKHFAVYLFGRNLLDEEYYNNAINFRQPPNQDFFVGTPGDPLTVGFEIVGKF